MIAYLVVALLLIQPQRCVSWIPAQCHTKSPKQFGHLKLVQSSLLAPVTRTKSNTKLFVEVESGYEVFPMSTKLALVEEAKKLDSNLAQGKESGSYCDVGWSNRLGTVLTPASIPGVFTGDRPFYWNKIDVGGRMTVIQLPSKDSESSFDLWVHSPVGLDPPLMDALKELGTVKYIVSPNYEHLKYAPQWAEAFPDAYLWGCPGLIERLPDLSFAGEIPFGCRPVSWNKGQKAGKVQQLDNCWDLEAIQPLHIDSEVNPFTGTSFFNEVIFYHAPSQSLITTDFYWNYPQSTGIPNSHLEQESWELAPAVDKIPFGSRLWKFAMDKIYHPFYNNFMISSKSDYNDIVDFIVQELEISTIIPCHGDIIRGKDVVKNVMERFLRL